MKSNDHITIKVVSQMENLVYEGVRQKKLASVSKMNALLGISNPQKRAEDTQVKTSVSYELYSSNLNVESKEGDPAAGIPAQPISLCAEETLYRFLSLGDIAASKRKEFFEKVEEGKARLMSKYGEHKAIPKEELASLARELRPYKVTLWKHQIVTTRTQSTPFEGARLTKDGRYTATVKSKTIYTMAPLSDSQLEQLKKILAGELVASPTGTVARRETENGYVAFWRNPETGRIVMSEDKAQFS